MLIECGREVAFSAASCTPDLARVECHVVEYVPTYICDRLLGRREGGRGEGGNVHEMTLARENLRRGEQVSRAKCHRSTRDCRPRRRLKMLQILESEIRSYGALIEHVKRRIVFSSDVGHPDPNYSSSWDRMELYTIPRQLLLLRQHRLSESAANRLNK